MRLILLLLLLPSVSLAQNYRGGDFRNNSASIVWVRIQAQNTSRYPWVDMGSVAAGARGEYGDWYYGSGTDFLGEFRVYSDSSYVNLLASGSAALVAYSGGYAVIYSYSGQASAQSTNHVACVTFQNTKYVSGQRWHVLFEGYQNGANTSRPVYDKVLPWKGSPVTFCYTNTGGAFQLIAAGEDPEDPDGWEIVEPVNSHPEPSPTAPPGDYPNGGGGSTGNSSTNNLPAGPGNFSNDAAGIIKALAELRYGVESKLAGIQTTLQGLTNLTSSAGNTNTSGFTNAASMGNTNGGAGLPSGAASAVNSVGDFDPEATSTGLDVRTAPSALTMDFCGRTISFDPEVLSPGIGAWSRMILSIPLLLWFLYEVSKLFSKLAATYASAETGGVPDLNASLFGSGGNMAGMATAVIVTTAFLAIWGVLFTWFYDTLMDKIGLANNVGSEISSGNAVAVYLLLLFIPVQLYLTLGSTLAIVHFGAGKIVILSSSASRYLWGK